MTSCRENPLFLLVASLLVALTVFVGPFGQASAESAKARVVIMADMGNEPDEEQQMMHLLLYANMFEVEGLIACSGKYLHSSVNDINRKKVRPDLFVKLINGYAEVVDNLQKHAEGWPTPAYLRSIVRAGTSDYGLAAVGPGKDNEATRFLEAIILKDNPRKLYIVANAGTNTLAQALIDLDERHTDEQMRALCERIILFENGA